MGEELFVGRHAELSSLERAFESPQSALIPIYGRRRVGKSRLILHFCQNKPALYFQGKQTSTTLQLSEFLREAARVLNQPLLANFRADSWGDALNACVDSWQGDQKLVLVLDEFQWMVENDKGLPSDIQALWDRRWRDSGNLLLILCGSYIGFMEREVLGQKSPLFGRRTGQILLRPFNYPDAADFQPAYSVVDKAKAYFICGGVPAYLRLFDDKKTIAQNIEQNILDEYAPLFREPEFLLKEELREVERFYSIMTAMAVGARTATQLAEQTGLDVRGQNYYIQSLERLGYLKKRYPLLPQGQKKRQVRYAMADPLLRFWFRFVYPNTSFLAQSGPRQTYQIRIKPQLEAYFGTCFERLCREALPHLVPDQGLAPDDTVGEYWQKDVQIDLVGIRDEGWIDIGECKWGKVPSLPALEKELEQKISRYPNPTNATIVGHLFTRNPLRGKRQPGVERHSLIELYNVG